MDEVNTVTVQLPVVSVNVANVHSKLENVRARIRENRTVQANAAAALADVESEVGKYWDLITAEEYDCDPIEFWCEREMSFKILAPIACEILSVPATSAPIERAFSVAGSVLGNKRHSLSNKMLNQEILFKMNGFLLTD